MAVSVVMPALEMAQETGKLVAWLKKEGEQVKKGDMLLEVETDKAVVEVEAQGNGVLAGVTAKAGDVVPVGQTIAWLVQPGEAVPAAGGAPAQTGRKMEAPAAAAAVAAPVAAAPTSVAGARISPKARRLAREHGVDIGSLAGSGPGGEILADDILKAASAQGAGAPSPAARGSEARPAPSGPAPSAPAPSGPAPSGQTSSGPAPSAPAHTAPTAGRSVTKDARPAAPAGDAAALSSIGRIMAERTTQSWTTVPHFFVARDVDATAMHATRSRLIPTVQASHGVKITHTDLLVVAVARALRQHPRMNASWKDGGIALNDEVNVALAMAVENAVVTAVIRNADQAAIGEIAQRRRELAERARANRLQPADISGATFTISNLGMYDVDAFTAIIVPPQAGILAVGAMTDRVVAVSGYIGIRPMMTLTLSSDHRVVDGARAAAFLNDIVLTLNSGVGDA